MNDLQSKNIKISGTEDVGWGIKLKSETGEIYNVPKLKKDTQDKTVAFKTLEMLNGWGMSLTKNVKFATVPNKQGGNSRYVRMIGEPEVASNENMGAEQDNRPNQVKTTSDPQNEPSSSGYSQPPNFLKPENTYNQEIDKKAFGMCKYGFLIEAYKIFGIGMEGSVVNSNSPDLKEIEKTAEKWAEMSIRMLPKEELGNNGEIPDGQREDTAELQRKEPVIDLDASYNQPLH